MRIAFCLFKYFPYGGLQRDFLRIAELCQSNGHQIIVYCMQWQGEIPEGFDVNIIPNKSCTNHGKAEQFASDVRCLLSKKPADIVVGFNKMPGLDIYYCADSCYTTKVAEQKQGFIKLFYGLTRRYKTYKSLEDAVFNKDLNTKILFISEQEQENYKKAYSTHSSRCYLLPPHINKKRFTPVLDLFSKAKIKQEYAELLNLDINNPWLLMVGSGFKTKGVDRSILALKYLLDNNIQANLIVIGQDDASYFQKLAQKLGIAESIRFLGGRDDIARFMAVASLQLHPAYRENTGTVILEAIIMGLPVIASGICGYAKYIDQSGCGAVITEPFAQKNFNQIVYKILSENKTSELSHKGLIFREKADIYDADSKIIDIIENTANV